MANVLFDALFAPHAEDDRDFLVLPDGATQSYREFLAEIARLAGALVALGVEPGDRVVVQAPKSARALALYGACVQSGAVLLPLNTAYTAAEVDYFVGDAQARVMVCDPANAERLGPIAQARGAILQTLDAAGEGSLAGLAADQPVRFETVARDADDLAALLYTSGTTGRSKGAMLTHANLLSNTEVLVDEWRFGPEDVLLHALPIFHTHGLFVATNISLAAGGSMILLPGFELEAVLRWLPEATTMMGVPTFYTRLLDDPRFTRELVGHVRLFVSGSAPLLAETHVEFEARTGHRILERYGMTETNMNTSNPYEGERRAGTVGPPLPGISLRVVDPETGAPLPQGEIGMIELTGPNVCQGYWRMPEKTAEAFRPDGYFITGDLGCIDADGYVQIVGRGKDLVISGGFNIYPKEVELLLDEQAGVLESAVIGVPHPDLGEGVVAVLVPRAGAAIDTESIAASIRDGIARFKQPRRYYVVDELPRNTMGKVQKNLLRDRFGDAFAR